jgi:hypothetical protein
MALRITSDTRAKVETLSIDLAMHTFSKNTFLPPNDKNAHVLWAYSSKSFRKIVCRRLELTSSGSPIYSASPQKSSGFWKILLNKRVRSPTPRLLLFVDLRRTFTGNVQNPSVFLDLTDSCPRAKLPLYLAVQLHASGRPFCTSFLPTISFRRYR